MLLLSAAQRFSLLLPVSNMTPFPTPVARPLEATLLAYDTIQCLPFLVQVIVRPLPLPS